MAKWWQKLLDGNVAVGQVVVAKGPHDGERHTWKYSGWQEGYPNPAEGVHLWTSDDGFTYGPKDIIAAEGGK